MQGYYIIWKKEAEKEERIVFAIEKEKFAADLYNSAVFEYTHWVPELDGACPKIDAKFSDKRTRAEKLRAGYIMDADYLYGRVHGDMEDDGIATEAKNAWKAARQKIKTKYPK